MNSDDAKVLGGLAGMMVLLICGIITLFGGCGCDRTPAKSASGVEMVSTKVAVDSEGVTVEQRNIINRLKMDNEIGAIKHLYVISAYSGDVLIYSTVKGKVTSGGKRLTPTSVIDPRETNYQSGMTVNIGGTLYKTGEVIQDDGCFGSSGDYLYWFSSNGIYHQHYLSGGQIVHISDHPITVGKVILNFEESAKNK